MTIVSDPDYDVEGPDEDPTAIVDHDSEDSTDELEVEDELETEDELGAEDQAEDAEDELETEDELEEDELGTEDLVEDEPVEEPVVVEAEPTPEVVATTERRPLAPAPKSETTSQPPQPWTTRQLLSVVQRTLLVFTVMGMIGYGLGAIRGDSHVARTEFVYTLDESVPDSFLREDRRLLTQVVTFKSDAVLTPVAAQFDLTVDELRSKIDVETLELSEVLRLDVADANAERAVTLNRAVLDQYLRVITDATPAGESEELAERRIDVTQQLAEADGARRSLLEDRQRDAVLEVRQDSIQRQIDLKDEQIGRILQSLDTAVLQSAGSARVATITEQLDAEQASLAKLETDLATVGSERAMLNTETTAEPALLREIERLEAKLTTIDDELAERELAPLVASPIRELSQPIVLFRSMHLFGLQGMALGLMAAIPIAALVAYRTRRQQLWFE